MKQKIHLPSHSEPSLRVAKPFGKLKTGFEKSSTHFQISKLSQLGIFSFFFLLSSFLSYGQEYQWQWAKSGGGELGFSGGVTQSFRDECVIDIAVDADNNYYYLMRINGNNPMYNDESLPENIALEHYGGKDILLLSTDENGNYRWHQVIGGYADDSAYNIVVDSIDGIYVNAYMYNSIESSNNSPTHLDPTVTLPQVPSWWDYSNNHPSFKWGYLLKYGQSDGNLLAYKAYQGEVNGYNNIGMSRLWIDSEDHLYTYVSLKNGIHLDGLVTVEDMDEVGEYKTYLVELDTSLNIVGTPREFPAMNNSPQNHFFAYNEELNTYYIGGKNSDSQAFSYDGVEIEEQSFILAINGETLEEEWRSGINSSSYNNAGNISSIFIDGDSNLYLSGKYTYSTSVSIGQRYFGDYALPHNIGGITFAHVPFVIKLNPEGNVEWVRTPDSFTNQFSPQKQNENESVTVVNGEVIIVPRNPGSIWGDFEIVSSQDYNTVPAIVRLDAQTGEVIGATHLEGYGAFTKVVADQNGDLVLGGSFFGQMFSDYDDIPTLQAVSNRTDFFMTKLVLDTDSSTDNYLQEHITVYPNPTDGLVYLQTKESLQNYTLYNMLGQAVGQGVFNDNHQIDLSTYTSGTYFLKVSTKEGDTGMFKVMKK